MKLKASIFLIITIESRYWYVCNELTYLLGVIYSNTSLSETLSPEDIEIIIAFNIIMNIRQGGLVWYEYSQIKREILYRIPTWMARYDNIENKRERIIKKVTQILAGITHYQVFVNFNKRTALSVTIRFLRRNGFDLPYRHNKRLQNELINLLIDIINRNDDDPSTFNDVERLLLKEVMDYSINDGSSLSNAS